MATVRTVDTTLQRVEEATPLYLDIPLKDLKLSDLLDFKNRCTALATDFANKEVAKNAAILANPYSVGDDVFYPYGVEDDTILYIIDTYKVTEVLDASLVIAQRYIGAVATNEFAQFNSADLYATLLDAQTEMSNRFAAS